MSHSSRLTLAQRALLICGALTVLMASAGALTAWRVNGTIDYEAKAAQHLQRYTALSGEVQQLNHLVTQLSSAFKNVMLRGAVDADRQKYLKEFEDHRKSIQNGLSSIQSGLSPEQDRDLLDSVKAWGGSFPVVADQYAKALSQYTGADPAQATELDKTVRGIDRPLTEAGQQIEKRVQAQYKQLALDVQAETASRLNGLLYTMSMIFALSLVLASVLLLAYARWVKRLLGAEPEVLVAWTREIAEGKLSAVRGESFDASEQSLYANFARMRTALAQLVEGIRQRSSAFDAAVAEIRYQLEASKEAAMTQADAGSKMASGMEQMSASVGHVAEAAAQSAQAAQLSSKSSEDGLEVVRATAKNIHDTASGALALSERISRLGEQSANISTIIQVIEGIAQQTNLLALNAAIEAARAGEQGRGFAVVADEVRQLAERTTKSTTEIENMVSKIQQDTAEVVDEVAQWKDRSSSSLEQVKRAEELMLNIQNQAMTVTSMVSEVKQALKEQTTVSCELSGQVEKMAGRTEENSNCLEEVMGHLRQLSQNSSELLSETRKFVV